MHWGPIVCHFVFFVGKRKGQNTNKAYSLHFLKLEWEQASHVGRFAISLLAKAKGQCICSEVVGLFLTVLDN
jgi:hypothetical protein